MTDLRTAAQQALEALKGYRRELGDQQPCDAEQALEAALAEPVQQGCDHCNHPLYAATKCRVCGRVTEVVQEPVAGRAAFERHAERLGYSVDPDTREGREGGYWSSHTQLMWLTWQAALAEPVQEPKPVAWLYRGNLHPFDPSDGASDPATPLYAHPPQRKPLSEDEIFKIENDIPDDVIGDRAWTICFARAIERAHGIGGEG